MDASVSCWCQLHSGWQRISVADDSGDPDDENVSQPGRGDQRNARRVLDEFLIVEKYEWTFVAAASSFSVA